MADIEKENDDRPITGGFDGIMSKVNGDMKKSKQDSIKAKLKDLLGKKAEHERNIKIINVEIEKIRTDFEAGVL